MKNPPVVHRHGFPWKGLIAQTHIAVRLNFRSRAPLIYGYLVPVFFLLAFGSVFRAGSPPLSREMGQLLTITILGGACFGLPTAMVAERDRGVWRRYRLLPFPAVTLVASLCVARVLLVGSTALLQVALAWCLFRTPLPAHPGQLLLAFGFVCLAFLGVGLVIGMLAENVPAVQAIGQCVFLPMIMVGGVGIPLRLLPASLQTVAGFLPGRYALEVLDACVLPTGGGLVSVPFALGALGVIGLAGFAAGFGLFRWDRGPRPLDRPARGWLALALAAWLLAGATAWGMRRHLSPSTPHPRPAVGGQTAAEPWQRLTSHDLAAVRFDGLPPDDGYLAPIADERAVPPKRVQAMVQTLAKWPPGHAGTPLERVRCLLVVCVSADLSEDEEEGDIALAIFHRLQDDFPASDLPRLLAWIALHPSEGTVTVDFSAFDIASPPGDSMVRERSAIYARKFLKRLLPTATTSTPRPAQSSAGSDAPHAARR